MDKRYLVRRETYLLTFPLQTLMSESALEMVYLLACASRIAGL